MSAIKNIGYFLSAMVLAKALGYTQSFFVAKVLGPENFGIWATLLLVVSYAPILCLGTVETLLKKVPYYLGRNDLAEVHGIEGTVLGSLVLSAGVVCLLACLTPFVLPLFAFPVGAGLTVMVLATIAINYFTCFFYYRFSAYENFKMTGAMDGLRAVLALALVGGMGCVWGLAGVVTGFLLHEAAMFFICAVLNIRQYGRPQPSFHRQPMVEAVKAGLSISLLWWVLTLTASVDRLVLGRMLGVAAVGYYAFGLSVAGILYLVPTVVGRVLYPNVNKLFGRKADVQAMKRVVLAPTLALATLLVNFQIGLVVVAPLFYVTILPKYRAGLMACHILVLGSFFVCLFRNAANYLIAANLERLFLKYIVATLVFNLFFDVGLVKAGFGMEGVALGTSLAGFFLTTVVWRRVLMGLGFTSCQRWRAMFELYLPFLVLLTVVGVHGWLIPSLFQSFNFRSIAVGLWWMLLVNGILWCIPMYRAEAVTWWERIRRVRESVPPAVPAARSAL